MDREHERVFNDRYGPRVRFTARPGIFVSVDISEVLDNTQQDSLVTILSLPDRVWKVSLYLCYLGRNLISTTK